MTDLCKDCCIVVDHGPDFREDSGSRLDVEANSRGRTGGALLSNLAKTTWTCIVEGVMEYCRVIYDLFPLSYKILVLCSDEVVTEINTFEDENQNTQHLLKGFGDIGLPRDDMEGGYSQVFPGVAQAAETLLKRPREQLKRIVVVTRVQDERDSQSISNVVWEMQNQMEKENISNIDLLVVNISNDKLFHPRKQVSEHLTVTLISMKLSKCANKLALLTRRHYNLQSTIVTGIPMKEEQNSGTSANYDVEVIHLAATHHNREWLENADELLPKKSSRSAVTLKWCTPKSTSPNELQQCVGTYSVTPAEVNSRPAACLTMFLLQGRTVMLEEPNKSGGKVLTHMLSSHGGELYIHVLAIGRNPLEDPPSISEGVGGRVTDYRCNDFGRIMKEMRLAPFEGELNFDEPNDQAIARLKRFSKHWPMIISDTLIFNMSAKLGPLLTLLMQPILTEAEVQDIKKVIYKLQAMESKNDTLPLPIVTLKGKASKKEDQYKSLWAELDVFVEGVSTTSPMHKKVLDCLRGTQDIPEKQEDSKQSDEKSWKELERYQSMSVREKKEFNEKRAPPSDPRVTDPRLTDPRVAPSDPRRKRRSSENSKSPPAKKSPRSPFHNSSDESELHVKRRIVDPRMPFSQEKCSVLSMWSDRLKSSASCRHEEFYGRKMAVNGRFELYKKDEDENAADTSLNKPALKEWV